MQVFSERGLVVTDVLSPLQVLSKNLFNVGWAVESVAANVVVAKKNGLPVTGEYVHSLHVPS